MAGDASGGATGDQIALRRLADVYASAVDDGDGVRMASLFVPNGRLVVFPPDSDVALREWEGLDGFQRLLQVLRDSYVRTVHFIGNHWADIDGDDAHGETYCLACHLRTAGQAAEEEVAVIRYRDSYRRTSDGWRFSRREARRQWTTVHEVASATHEIDAALRRRGQGR